MRNARVRSDNTSGFKGACWDKSKRKWKVQIHVNGKHINLGGFDSREAAARAYDRAAREYHGEFASPDDKAA
jgi:hypothetical protein